jgi:hypothetical protein
MLQILKVYISTASNGHQKQLQNTHHADSQQVLLSHLGLIQQSGIGTVMKNNNTARPAPAHGTLIIYKHNNSATLNLFITLAAGAIMKFTCWQVTCETVRLAQDQLQSLQEPGCLGLLVPRPRHSSLLAK